MRRDYEPNPVIVKRAVEIWKEMLKNPKYDNLGGTEVHIPSLMATMLAEQAPKNNTGIILEKFGEELEKLLMEPVTTTMHNGDPWTRRINYLNVDYDPDQILTLAAERSGLKMQFPWKTSMYLYEDKVGVSYGYAAPILYHHPLENGRWFISDLTGRDVDKIVDLIKNGILNLDLSPVK